MSDQTAIVVAFVWFAGPLLGVVIGRFSHEPRSSIPAARLTRRQRRNLPGVHCTDLKSAISSEPRAFARQSLRFFYHAQAELYGRAMEAAGEARPADHNIVAVEKTPPFPVTIFRFSAELLELGAKMNRIWMERLLQCEAANVWPVYAPAPAVIDLVLEEGWDAS